MTTTDTDTRSYDIPAEDFGRLAHRVADLVRRGEKLGIETGLRITAGAPHDVVLGDDEDLRNPRRLVRVVTVTIEGKPAKLAGWTLAAIIKHEPEGRFVHCWQGGEIPERFTVLDPLRCDHCGSRQRRTTQFVLANDDGREAVVGSTCVADFLGHKDPALVAAWMEAMAGLERDLVDRIAGEGDGRGEAVISLAGFLTWVAWSIRRDGWQRMSDEFPTAPAVWGLLTTEHVLREKILAGGNGPTDGDALAASAALAWVRDPAATDVPTGDYGYNLRLVVANPEHDVVRRRTIGLAASLIPVYQRAMERRAEAEAAARAKALQPSRHLGTVGKRQTFAGLTCVSIRSFESQWGASVLVRMRDAENNLVIWWTSWSALPGAIEEGAAFDLVGTVKAHAEYKGEAQTVLTRCRVGNVLVAGPSAVVQARLAGGAA